MKFVSCYKPAPLHFSVQWWGLQKGQIWPVQIYQDGKRLTAHMVKACKHIPDYQQKRSRGGGVTNSIITLPEELSSMSSSRPSISTNRGRSQPRRPCRTHHSLCQPEQTASLACTLRVCPSEPADMFSDIGHLFLMQALVPSCFKCPLSLSPSHPILIPLWPVKNDCHPVPLTPVVTKCFERTIKSHIQDIIPDTLDPHQLAYRHNRSTDDTVSVVIRTVPTHLQGGNTYCENAVHWLQLCIQYRHSTQSLWQAAPLTHRPQ